MERDPIEQLINGQNNLLKELSELDTDVNYRAIEELMAQERQKLFKNLGKSVIENQHFEDTKQTWQSDETVE